MPSEEVEERRRRRRKERTKTNLVDKLGDFLLESLHHIGQSLDFVFLMEVNGTFGADCLLVSVAVGVDFKVRMLVTTSDSHHSTTTTSWFHSFIKRDELVMRKHLWFEMSPLAEGTKDEEQSLQ